MSNETITRPKLYGCYPEQLFNILFLRTEDAVTDNAVNVDL